MDRSSSYKGFGAFQSYATSQIQPKSEGDDEYPEADPGHGHGPFQIGRATFTEALIYLYDAMAGIRVHVVHFSNDDHKRETQEHSCKKKKKKKAHKQNLQRLYMYVHTLMTYAHISFRYMYDMYACFYQSISRSINPFIHPSINQSFDQFIHPSIHPSVHMYAININMSSCCQIGSVISHGVFTIGGGR